MSTRRFSRLRLATAIGPLLVLSGAWTATGAHPEQHQQDVAAKDPSISPEALPQAPLGKPASVTAPAATSQPAVDHSRRATTGPVSATDIPASALAAYQRAATIIDDADPACHLDWPLLAGIGRVESDHGRTGGSRLNASGVASPAVLGPALTGKHHTSRVVDTDRGRYDGDSRYDRALGPLQFLPSTWAIVGVDADGDGKRDPQDVNDAALAAAVFLCSGSDLSDPAAQRAAVLRYNHSRSYVATVLQVAAAYRAGGVPGGTVTIQQLGAPLPPVTEPARLPAAHQRGEHGGHGHHAAHHDAQHQAQHHAQHHGQGVAAGTPQHPAHHVAAGVDNGTRADGSTQGGSATLGGAGGAGDTTAPDAPTITSLDSPTKNATPTISGTGEPKAIVTVTLAGPTPTTAAVPVDGRGNWSLTPSTIADGDYSVTATQKDAAGNTSAASTASTLTVDTKAPGAATITGTLTAGGTTVSGTGGEAGATLTVLVDGAFRGTVTVRPGDAWTVKLDAPLTAGEKVTATQTDAAGNSSPASAEVTVLAAEEERTPSDEVSPSDSPPPAN